MPTQQLPHDVAAAIGHAAVSTLYIQMRYERDRGGSSNDQNDDESSGDEPTHQPPTLQKSYAWIAVFVWWRRLESNRTRQANVALVIRESIQILSALASCKGYGLHENPKFWMEVWGRRCQQLEQQRFATESGEGGKSPLVPSKDHLFPRFLFIAETLDETADAVINAVNELMLLEPQAHTSATYRSTMETLYGYMDPSRYHRAIDCALDIRANPSQFEKVNQLVVSSITTAANFYPKAYSWNAPLVVKNVFLTVPNCFTMVHPKRWNEDVTFVDSNKVNIDVLHLDVRWFENTKSSHQHMVQSLMWGLAHSQNESSTLRNSSGKLTSKTSFRCLELSMRVVPDALHFALCSALPSFTSLQELNILAFGSSSFMWSWLSLALFHQASPSNIHNLSLTNLTLDMESVNAMKQVLNQPWHIAIQSLINQYEQRTDKGGLSLNKSHPTDYAHNSIPPNKILRVTVKHHTKVRVKPERGLLADPVLVVLHHDQVFTVVEILPGWRCEWMRILVPGYGVGFVTQRDVLQMEEIQVELNQSHSIRSLSMLSTDTNATIAFMRAIGKPLRSLEITFRTSFTRLACPFSKVQLRELLRCCPNLTCLSIHTPQINDLTPLVEAYANGECNIASLEINARAIHPQCLEDLNSQLRDRTSQMYRLLRELSLRATAMSEDNLKSILKTLDINRSLRFVQVAIPPHLHERFLPRFVARHGEEIRGNFSLRAKLAFLSAIGYHSKSTSTLCNVERAVLETILMYAGNDMRVITINKTR